MNINHKRPQRRTSLLLACAAAALMIPLSATAYDSTSKDEDKSAQDRAKSMMESVSDTASDMRMHLAIETKFAGSSELNVFSINTDVSDGVVRLEGEVETNTERELAAELAKSVDGVKKVENRLEVKGDDPSFVDRIRNGASDAALTARVKTRLLTSRNTSGLAIKVESDGNVVTLSGEVKSDAERDLAEMIATNTSGVADVRNRIEVKGS